MKRIAKIAVPIAALGLAIILVVWLKTTKPVTPATPSEERAWTVDTVAAHFQDQTPDLFLYGEIVADREAELRALVTGPIIEVTESFRDGQPVKAGEILLRTDPFDFEQELIQAKAAAREARVHLGELESRLASEQTMVAQDRTQAEIAGRDLARREMLSRDVVSERALDESRGTFSKAQNQVTLREERVNALNAQGDRQRVVIERLDAAAKRAKRRLDDTQLKAPFDGVLADTTADRGQRLNAGDKVARLIDPSALEARFFLSTSQYASAIGDAHAGEGLGRPVSVIWRAGGRDWIFDAQMQRVDAEIDTNLGGLHGYATLSGLTAETRLRPGAFVEVILADRVYADSVLLPERALHGDATVYVVADERLERRAVTVLARTGADMIVQGDLAEGDAVVVTRFDEIGPGIKVTVGQRAGP